MVITVERASDADLPAVQAMLEAAELTTLGLMEAPTSLFIARAEDEIVGAAALERHGTVGLVRSLMVIESRRRAGLGTLLVDAVEAEAKTLGLDSLYLLTETAAPFFERLGYRPVGRGDAPAAVAASVEWSIACTDTALPMAKDVAGLQSPVTTSHQSPASRR